MTVSGFLDFFYLLCLDVRWQMIDYCKSRLLDLSGKSDFIENFVSVITTSFNIGVEITMKYIIFVCY